MTDARRASNYDVCACCIAYLRKGSLQIQVAFLTRAEFCLQSSNPSPHAAVDAVRSRYVARCVDMDHCLPERERERERDSQTDRQTETDRQRQTETDRGRVKEMS